MEPLEHEITPENYNRLIELLKKDSVTLALSESKSGTMVFSISQSDSYGRGVTICRAIEALYSSVSKEKDEITINGVVYVPKEKKGE